MRHDVTEIAARRMALLYIKRTNGQTTKWTKLNKVRRYLWRSVAQRASEAVNAGSFQPDGDLDSLARNIAGLYLASTGRGEWHTITSADRSLWRLVARLAIVVFRPELVPNEAACDVAPHDLTDESLHA